MDSNLFLLYSGSEELDINNSPVILTDYPEEPVEKTDAETNDYNIDDYIEVLLPGNRWEGDNPYDNDFIEEPSVEISPKGVSSLPGNISFIFN